MFIKICINKSQTCFMVIVCMAYMVKKENYFLRDFIEMIDLLKLTYFQSITVLLQPEMLFARSMSKP